VSSLITSETTVVFHEIQLGSYAIEGGLVAIIFNLTASIIPQWLAFKLLRWMQHFYQPTWEHERSGLVTMKTRSYRATVKPILM
jgi:hypothetical protein